MSANNYDWAQALSASPGSQLAALQARQYESETTQRMMKSSSTTLRCILASCGVLTTRAWASILQRQLARIQKTHGTV